jgi:diaminopimelate epimerase
MSYFKFIKMHGLGNDFVIIDNRQNLVQIKKKETLKKIGSRNFGIGCDQILIIESYDNKNAEVIIFNNDGSEAGACGNGVRCVASYLMNKQNTTEIRIKTISGSLDCWFENKNCFVNMGKPCFDWSEIPLSKHLEKQIIKIDEFELFCLSMGNPHAVIFFEDENDLNKIDIENIGKKIQSNYIFPESVNVEFATILEDKTIRMKVWERGAGRTLACGTGACATLVAANQQNLSLRKNDIILDGGKLTINWLESEDVIMSGEVNLVFKGDFYCD